MFQIWYLNKNYIPNIQNLIIAGLNFNKNLYDKKERINIRSFCYLINRRLLSYSVVAGVSVVSVVSAFLNVYTRGSVPPSIVKLITILDTLLEISVFTPSGEIS